MHLQPTNLIKTIDHLVHRNLLLLLIVLAIMLAIFAPVPASWLKKFDFNVVLVATIFISQGIKMDLAHAQKLKKYLKLLAVAALVSIVAYPFLAWVMVKLFGLSSDHKVGFLLVTCFPSSLEAAMALSASAGGDPLTAVILITVLNILGLISIPMNLSLWLGAESPVSEFEVLHKLVTYLFAPIIVGQLLRKFIPSLPSKMHRINHYLPMLCITALVYISCSEESGLLRELHLHDLLHVVAPSVLLHMIMLGMAFLAASYWLRLDESSKRSFLFITSVKPMSLSVALWAVSYAKHHPVAIFPIVIFYVCEIAMDGFIISRIVAKDNAAEMPKVRS